MEMIFFFYLRLLEVGFSIPCTECRQRGFRNRPCPECARLPGRRVHLVLEAPCRPEKVEGSSNASPWESWARGGEGFSATLLRGSHHFQPPSSWGPVGTAVDSGVTGGHWVTQKERGAEGCPAPRIWSSCGGLRQGTQPLHASFFSWVEWVHLSAHPRLGSSPMSPLP